MTTLKVDPKHIAHAAAQGVAIALAARTEAAAHRGPFHIICGLPPAELFEVILEGDTASGFKVASVQPKSVGR